MLLTGDFRITTHVALLVVDLIRFVELGLKGTVETRGIPLSEVLEVMVHMQVLIVKLVGCSLTERPIYSHSYKALLVPLWSA